MASWFKKHFSCIKREPSVIVTSSASSGVVESNKKNKNENFLASDDQDTVDGVQHQRLDKIILKNDLTRKNSNTLIKKNSNEYRDYGKNAESQYIAENYFKMRNNSIKQNNNNNLGKKIKIEHNDNQMLSSNVRQVNNRATPRELPRVIREYNNNMNLQELMKKLRACNECVSQKRICKFLFMFLQG